MTSSAPVDPDFLALLACPACEPRQALSLSEDQHSLVCTACKREYPISRHGYPDLRVETESRTLDD